MPAPLLPSYYGFFMKYLICLALLIAPPAFAKWWIEPSELAVRADLQFLADHRLLSQPLNTYPLVWSAIATELQALDPQSLSTRQQAARQRLLAAWQQDQQLGFSYQVDAATSENRFYSFGDHFRDKAAVQVRYQFSSQHLSGKLAAATTTRGDEGQRWRADDSYLAARLGNWVISVGSLDRYWGPSWDTSLQLSQNARPIPMLSLTRYNSEALDLPLLRWLGPWTFTTGFGQLEGERAIPNARLWAARASAKPLAGLEIGTSWSMLWGGEGYGNGLSDWWQDLFQGGSEQGTENMLAGYDIRWSDVIAGVPYGLYAQVTAEDFHREKRRLINTAFLLGADIYVEALDSRIYLEFSDTKVGCSAESRKLYNCLYEHSFHLDGYRYYRQSLGSTYDNDALTWVAGIITPLATQISWHNKVRWLRLNLDGLDLSEPGGNKVSPGRYEQVLQAQTTYQYQLQDGKLSITAALTHRHWPGIAKGDRIEPALALSWEGRF